MALPVADDDGATLLELIVAVVIMGITVVAVLGGLMTSIQTSDLHRKQATAGTYARDYAETVNRYVAAGNYAPCAGHANYAAAFATVPVPSGFKDPVASVRYWDPAWTAGSAASPWVSSCTTSSDVGLQQVTVQVESTDGRATETSVVVVRRP